MKSKRTTSLCSSSTRTSSRDDIDEVDGDRSSDESDDDEKERANDMPVTFEYVQGAQSPAFHFKLLKAAEPSVTASTASSQSASASRKGTRASSKVSSQVTVSNRKNQHQPQQLVEPVLDAASDDCSAKVEIANQSQFLKFLTIREFFSNRKNWSVTEESIIIWLGFMFFSVVVGCILHFLMA